MRERKEDIILFIKSFLEELNEEYDKNIKGIETAAVNVLASYKWEGNIRELRNVIEQMVVLCRDDIITKDMIPEYIIEEVEKGKGIDKFSDLEEFKKEDIGLREILLNYEKLLINKALKDSKGNITEAARILKIPRSTLHYKIDNYGINVNSLT